MLFVKKCLDGLEPISTNYAKIELVNKRHQGILIRVHMQVRVGVCVYTCVRVGDGVRKCMLFYSMFIRPPCFLPYTSLIIFTKLLFSIYLSLEKGAP